MENRNIKIASLLFVLLASCLVVTLCSCSGHGAKSGKTKTVEDTWGRKVDVPETVRKISTIGSATRYVVYAGASDKLVSVTEMDKPSEGRPYTVAIADNIADLPTTNNGNHINSTNVDKEQLLNLLPDVIVSSRSKEECESLQNEIHIPVVGIYTQDKIFDEEVYKAIDVTAQAAGTQNIAEQKINWLKNTESELISRCSGSNKKVYRGAVNFKGSKNLCGTVSDYCIYNTLKLNNVAHRDDISNAYETNLEKILSWNPDYIFMDCTNMKLVKEQMNNSPEVFKQLTAFNNKNAYTVGPFNNNGTNLEYALCELYYTGKIIYPGNFSDIDLDAKFSEIFSLLDGSNIYPKLKEKGISFDKAAI